MHFILVCSFLTAILNMKNVVLLKLEIKPIYFIFVPKWSSLFYHMLAVTAANIWYLLVCNLSNFSTPQWWVVREWACLSGITGLDINTVHGDKEGNGFVLQSVYCGNSVDTNRNPTKVTAANEQSKTKCFCLQRKSLHLEYRNVS